MHALLKLLPILTLVFVSTNAYSFNDRTDLIISEAKKTGLTELKVFEVGKINVKLSITAAAEEIIKTSGFDLPDSTFEIAQFSTFIEQTISDNIGYFHIVAPNSSFSEIHLLLNDLKEDRRSTISRTPVNSRIIEMDVRRWHKIYKRHRSFLGPLSAIHEYAHINIFFLDDKEERLIRELIAVSFESINWIRLHGEKTYVDRYLSLVGGELTKPEELLDRRYLNMTQVRHLVYGLFVRILDGRYVIPKEVSVIEVLGRFSSSFINEKAIGDGGFNEALKTAGIRNQNDTQVTIDILRNDIISSIKPSIAGESLGTES